MTFLQLAQKLHLILRIGTETPGTQPVHVDDSANDGAVAEIIQYVQHAYLDICRLDTGWDFLRAAATIVLPAGQRVLSAATIQSAFPDLDTITPFTGSERAFFGITPTNVAGAAEMTLLLIPVGQWYGQYDTPPLPTGQPCYAVLNPDGGIECDAIADQDYTLRFNYAKAATPLTQDSDEPVFPARYHNAIIWYAVLHYYCATRDGTAELRAKADVELKRELTRLYNEQLPDFTLL